MAFTRVYKNMAQAENMSKTYKTGERMFDTVKTASSKTDMQGIRQFRDAQKASKETAAKVLQRSKAGEPIEIMKGGKRFHKQTDGKWYTD